MKTNIIKKLKGKSHIHLNCDFLSIKKVILFFIVSLLIFSCNQGNKDNYPLLNYTECYDIDIPEPSDLCFGSNASILYTVSDNTAKVYKITNKGAVMSALNYTGSDPEGVCNYNNQYIYVAEERTRKIIKMDLQGNVLAQVLLDIENNSENSGLEGISYASFNEHFYIVNETNPGLLIETDKNLNILNTYTLSFADDYSGICVDNTNQVLWILSDLSATVTKCSLQGKQIESFHIPVTNPEGIAVDPSSNTMYIISDSESKLYVFNLNE